MSKLDWKKELGFLYEASAKKASLVDVPELGFLMIDGHGNPNTEPRFRDAVEALYGLSYTLKFEIKLADPEQDYKVMPLEAVWWMADGSAFNMDDRKRWCWTLMIGQPEAVTPARIKRAREDLKKRRSSPLLDEVRYERWREGFAAQVLHVGPYDAEGPTLDLLRAFIEEQGKTRRGKHHEIYLSDPRRCAPEKLKTILRNPVE
ncbi:MAG: GyrI-like domain-containing protein [Candidatus Hydrogenedentes bacterium]|nr:GyrI-like domain-containing protein [Candidatus Hydrogenedentota bacterium]